MDIGVFWPGLVMVGGSCGAAEDWRLAVVLTVGGVRGRLTFGTMPLLELYLQTANEPFSWSTDSRNGLKLVRVQSTGVCSRSIYYQNTVGSTSASTSLVATVIPYTLLVMPSVLVSAPRLPHHTFATWDAGTRALPRI